MAKGTVKWFSEEKGYGFIVPDEGGKDLFIHSSAVKTQNRCLGKGEKVEYNIVDGEKGPQAIDAVPIYEEE